MIDKCHQTLCLIRMWFKCEIYQYIFFLDSMECESYKFEAYTFLTDFEASWTCEFDFMKERFLKSCDELYNNLSVKNDSWFSYDPFQNMKTWSWFNVKPQP